MRNKPLTDVPLERSYWVEKPVLLAGVYPGAPDRAETREKLRSLLEAGVLSFCNLTEEADSLENYEADLEELAGELGVDARMERFGIKDIHSTSVEHMARILDWIDSQILENRPVYVHCWGGIGRTGMVVGCWLVRHRKATGETVLDHVKELRRGTPDVDRPSPENDEQRALVQEWGSHEMRTPRPAARESGTQAPPRKSQAPPRQAPPRRAPSRKTPSLQSPAPGMVKRAQGCLLGQLAGDALGSLVEFRTPEDIRAEYPDGVRELKDGGTWNTIAGQPTDDSEMALALARSIVRTGEYDPDKALAVYREWLNSKPFDLGNTIRSSLKGQRNSASQANGAMMRVSPLGIFAARFDRRKAGEWGRADAELTHPNHVCLQANELYTMAIAEAVASGPTPDDLRQRIDRWATERPVDPSLASALRSSRSERPTDFVRQQGWVLIAFQNALYQLGHAASFEDAIVDTVMQGGDTDTNAAICGALLGAVHGLDAIPAQWRRTLEACRPEAGRPDVVHPRPADYWPVDALELAAALLGAHDA